MKDSLARIQAPKDLKLARSRYQHPQESDMLYVLVRERERRKKKEKGKTIQKCSSVLAEVSQ